LILLDFLSPQQNLPPALPPALVKWRFLTRFGAGCPPFPPLLFDDDDGPKQDETDKD